MKSQINDQTLKTPEIYLNPLSISIVSTISLSFVRSNHFVHIHRRHWRHQ